MEVSFLNKVKPMGECKEISGTAAKEIFLLHAVDHGGHGVVVFCSVLAPVRAVVEGVDVDDAKPEGSREDARAHTLSQLPIKDEEINPCQGEVALAGEEQAPMPAGNLLLAHGVEVADDVPEIPGRIESVHHELLV